MKDIINTKGVRAYLDENDTVQLNLEDVARGLGFTTETVSATSGKKYENELIFRIYRDWAVFFFKIINEFAQYGFYQFGDRTSFFCSDTLYTFQ